MNRSGYFVEFTTGKRAAKPTLPSLPRIPKVGEEYADKAEKAGGQPKPGSSPMPFSGVEEGTTASTFLPKGKEALEPPKGGKFPY